MHAKPSLGHAPFLVSIAHSFFDRVDSAAWLCQCELASVKVDCALWPGSSGSQCGLVPAALGSSGGKTEGGREGEKEGE